MIYVNEPLLIGNEKKYLNECIDSGWISSEGPFVKRFESEFALRFGHKNNSERDSLFRREEAVTDTKGGTQNIRIGTTKDDWQHGKGSKMWVKGSKVDNSMENAKPSIVMATRRTGGEDGEDDKEDPFGEGFIFQLASSVSMAKTEVETFKTNDRVEAKWKGKTWYPGKITSANGDGTYNVTWDDGDKEVNLPTGERVRSESGGNRGLDAYIGEVVAFDRELSLSEQRELQNYLSMKWGVGLSKETEVIQDQDDAWSFGGVKGETIGCGWDRDNNRMFFTKGGKLHSEREGGIRDCAVASERVRATGYFPTVISSRGSVIQARFCPPFAYTAMNDVYTKQDNAVAATRVKDADGNEQELIVKMHAKSRIELKWDALSSLSSLALPNEEKGGDDNDGRGGSTTALTLVPGDERGSSGKGRKGAPPPVLRYQVLSSPRIPLRVVQEMIEGSERPDDAIRALAKPNKWESNQYQLRLSVDEVAALEARDDGGASHDGILCDGYYPVPGIKIDDSGAVCRTQLAHLRPGATYTFRLVAWTRVGPSLVSEASTKVQVTPLDTGLKDGSKNAEKAHERMSGGESGGRRGSGGWGGGRGGSRGSRGRKSDLLWQAPSKQQVKDGVLKDIGLTGISLKKIMDELNAGNGGKTRIHNTLPVQDFYYTRPVPRRHFLTNDSTSNSADTSATTARTKGDGPVKRIHLHGLMALATLEYARATPLAKSVPATFAYPSDDAGVTERILADQNEVGEPNMTSPFLGDESTHGRGTRRAGFGPLNHWMPTSYDEHAFKGAGGFVMLYEMMQGKVKLNFDNIDSTMLRQKEEPLGVSPELRCPVGHELTPRVIRVAGYACTLCGDPVRANTELQQCRECASSAPFYSCANCCELVDDATPWTPDEDKQVSGNTGACCRCERGQRVD